MHFSIAVSYAAIIGTILPLAWTLIHSAYTGDTFLTYSKVGWFWLILGGIADSQSITSGVVAY